MSNIIERFLLKLSLISPETDTVRQEKGVLRDINKEENANSDMKKDIASGQSNKTIVDIERVRRIIDDRNKRSEKIIEDFENAITQELMITKDLTVAVRDSQLSPKQKVSFITHIKEKIFEPVKQELDKILQEEASFDHTNIALYKALKRSSLARDELFNVKKFRSAVRTQRSDTNHNIKSARRASSKKGSQFESLVKRLDDDAMEQLQFLNKALKTDIISLQEDSDLLAQYEEFLIKLKENSGFPPALASVEISKFEQDKRETIDTIKKHLVEMTRLFISEAERMDATVGVVEREAENEERRAA